LNAYSDVNKDLGSFFQKLGANTNATEGKAYQDQTAGYYTGGSLFARNTVHNADLANIRLPGYRAGCGGIDMHLGAFSFIKGQELIGALRSVGSSMASYALLLALETMSPQVKNIITELNNLAQKINQMNINSCEIAATTLGSILPQSEAANKHLCTMIGLDGQYSGFSDYAAAKQKCGPGGQRDATLDRGRSEPRFAKMLGSEFNLAWNAIQENAFLRSDANLAEFFMTISGTIVSTKNRDEGYDIKSKPSLADKNSLLTALLYGGRAKVYHCADSSGSRCLNVTHTDITIAPEHAFVTKVKGILTSIQNKIYEDQPLDKKEISFLNSTRLPFYKIINVSTAQRRGEAAIDITDYSELGAVDVLFQYLSEILDVIHESATHLKSVQVDDTQIRKFLEGLNLARSRVVERRMGTFQQVEQISSVIRKTEMIEKMIAAKLGALNSEGM
jgi:conjugative transfer pilus assembly protein TraH